MKLDIGELNLSVYRRAPDDPDPPVGTLQSALTGEESPFRSFEELGELLLARGSALHVKTDITKRRVKK